MAEQTSVIFRRIPLQIYGDDRLIYVRRKLKGIDGIRTEAMKWHGYDVARSDTDPFSPLAWAILGVLSLPWRAYEKLRSYLYRDWL